MIHIQRFIEICFLFILFFMMLIRNVKMSRQNKVAEMNRLNKKVTAILIRHGGEMNRRRVSMCLSLPDQTVTAQLAQMEKEGIIYIKGNDICLKDQIVIHPGLSGQVKG